MTWAIGGAFFPLLYHSLEINLSFIIMFFLIFLRCIINVIFFDLKDINNDKADNLKTLPVILGKKSTINILYIINVIAFIPLILGIYLNIISFMCNFFTSIPFLRLFIISVKLILHQVINWKQQHIH